MNAARDRALSPVVGGLLASRLMLLATVLGLSSGGWSRAAERTPVPPAGPAMVEDSPTTAVPPDTAASLPTESLDLWRPLIAMGLGVLVVLLLMIRLKFHAFVALILGALTISCFIPLDVTGFNRNVKGPGVKPHVIVGETAEPAQIVHRVTSSLGSAVAGIGILIAMASIIGKCMLVSGAADRIVKSSLDLLGARRAPLALMVSGFLLAIPVFFDTVFYLLVPLARSLYRQTGRDYLLYLCAIAAGGAITHTLVPPTPGPLLVVETLQVDIGPVILIGLCVAHRRRWWDCWQPAG